LTENELTSTGSSSYSVHAWRVYYKNGSEIDREELSSSEYDSKNGVIFYTADNDSRAKDVYSDSSSSSSSSGASDSSNSSDASSGNNYSNSQTSSNNSDSYSQGTSSNDNHNDNNSDDYSNSNNSDDDTGSDTSQAEPEPPADVPSDSE
jgi:hypothetical protein